MYYFCVSFDNFQLGLTKSRIYMVNGIILILLFFVMRILNYPIAVPVYAAQYHNWNIWSALKNLYPLCHTLSAIQFAFQAFWFYFLRKRHSYNNYDDEIFYLAQPLIVY